jgi:hypothetical protein
MGMEVSDQDYVDSFNAPQHLANTPEINTWMLDEVERQNIQSFQEDGKSLEYATTEAAKTKASVRKRIDDLMAEAGLLDG